MNQEQWDELSAEFQESRDRSFTEVERADAQRRFVLLIVKNFPAILAESEAAQKENEHLRCALRYYATGQHFSRGDNDAWDTVSGEPQNFWCDEAGTATVEDGSFAAHSLRNNMEWSAEDATPIEGEKPYLSLATFDKESKND